VPSADVETLVAAFLVVLVGFFTFALGYYIRLSGDATMVAGYRRLEITDEDALARLVGTYTAGVGVVTALVGGVFPFFPEPTHPLLFGGYLAALAVSVALVWLRARQYTAAGKR
jgi:uncharacterized protein YqgC (DUF456 family)